MQEMQESILNFKKLTQHNRMLSGHKLKQVKVRQSRKQIMVLQKKNRTKFNILSKEDTQDSEFRSFFWRIEDTKNCF